jgi:hypothetical protein
MMERRLESRFLCADLVKVDWLAGNDIGKDTGVSSRTVEAVLEDISTLGACVQVEERIPLGSAISISVTSDPSEQPARFSGEVSYCVFRDYGYFVGIRFADENRWSSSEFEPQHMTNLATLT